MNDLISRQAAIDALHTWFADGFEEDRWWNSTHVLAAIEGVPSAQPTADVVEVVRCKDCKHRKKNTFCLHNMRYEDDNGFCSYGERAE